MRNVVVTGAGAGLGRTLCESFCAAADRVHIRDVAEQAELPWLRTYSAERLRYTRANVGNSSSHGRRGISRLVMGSDAELVLRSSAVPVMLVREEADSTWTPSAAVA